MIGINDIWPDWRVEELLGHGAYGKVYRVSRTELGHTSYAAAKLIEIPQDASEVASLISMGMDNLSIRSYFEGTARDIIKEIAVMESLKGAPNIVAIEDYRLVEHEDSIGWTICIRMELLESLVEYQKRMGPPTIEEILKIGLDISNALIYCENQRIIHRDVKPENVFHSAFGEYKLGDFGIARQIANATKSALSQRGTGPYMAPEVVREERYGSNVDVYSLGIMLYRYLNKMRFPFLPPAPQPITTEDVTQAKLRRLRGDDLPAPLEADSALAEIVCKACAANAQQRYASARELYNDLKAYQEGRYSSRRGGQFPNRPPIDVPHVPSEDGGVRITLDPNGADSASPRAYTVAGGKPLILPESDSLVKDGVFAVGWNTKPDGSGRKFRPGEPFYWHEFGTVLYAEWPAGRRSVVVTLDGNGAKGVIPEERKSAIGSVFALPSVDAFEKSGKRAKGWNTRPDGSGASFAPGAAFQVPERDATLYVEWVDQPGNPWLKKAIAAAIAIVLAAVLVAVFLQPSKPEPQYVSYTVHYVVRGDLVELSDATTYQGVAGESVSILPPGFSGYKVVDTTSGGYTLTLSADGDNSITIYYDRDEQSSSTSSSASSSTSSSSEENVAENDNYVLPESDKRVYSTDELEVLSNEELFLGRNEIFARHGYVFKAPVLDSYFGGKSWYKADSSYGGNLSDTEKANADAIKEIEEERDSPYLDKDYVNRLVADFVSTNASGASTLIDLADPETYEDVNLFLSNFAEVQKFWLSGDFSDTSASAKDQEVEWGFWHVVINRDARVSNESVEIPGTTNGTTKSSTGIGEPGGSWYFCHVGVDAVEDVIERDFGVSYDLDGYRGGHYAEDGGNLYYGMPHGNAEMANYMVLATEAEGQQNDGVHIDFTLYQVSGEDAQFQDGNGYVGLIGNKSLYGMEESELINVGGKALYTGYATVAVLSDGAYALRAFHVDR